MQDVNLIVEEPETTPPGASAEETSKEPPTNQHTESGTPEPKKNGTTNEPGNLDKKNLDEGMPWWGWLVGGGVFLLVLVIGFGLWWWRRSKNTSKPDTGT